MYCVSITYQYFNSGLFSSFLFLFDEILLNIECKPALYTVDSLHGLCWDIYFIKILHTVYTKVLSNAVACFLFCFHNPLFILWNILDKTVFTWDFLMFYFLITCAKWFFICSITMQHSVCVDQYSVIMFIVHRQTVNMTLGVQMFANSTVIHSVIN